MFVFKVGGNMNKAWREFVEAETEEEAVRIALKRINTEYPGMYVECEYAELEDEKRD